MTILEIAERVQENTEGCEIVHTPPRPGDFPGKEISNARALEEIGWKAQTSFREGVRRYVEWVRNTTRPPDPVPGLKPVLRGSAGTEERPPRVLVMTADIGEGHDLPARMIKADVERDMPDAEVEVVDGLQAMGEDLQLGGRATARASPSAGCPGCSTCSTG